MCNNLRFTVKHNGPKLHLGNAVVNKANAKNNTVENGTELRQFVIDSKLGQFVTSEKGEVNFQWHDSRSGGI